MSWLALALQAIPILVKAFETFVPGKGQGAIKKTGVKETFHLVAQTAGAVSTGGQEETWQKIDKVIDPLIDAAVGAANVFGWDKVQDDDMAKWGL